MTIIENPFFLRPRDVINMRDIIKCKYERVWLLCIDSSVIQEEKMNFEGIFEEKISRNGLKKLCGKMEIIKCDIDIIQNSSIRRKIVKIDQNTLCKLFGKKNDWDIYELIVLMFEEGIERCKTYSTLNQKFNLKELQNMFIMGMQYKTLGSEMKIIEKLCSLEMTQYWMDWRNIRVNWNNEFPMRKFKYGDISKINIIPEIKGGKYEERTKDVIKQLAEKEEEESQDYDLFDNNNGTTSWRGKYFPAKNDCGDINGDYVNNLFGTIDDKYRFFLLNSFLVSREYCHLVVGKNVLEKTKDLYENYKNVYSTLFGYTWLTLFLEEYIIGTNTVKANRYVFELDCAEKLPMFPHTRNDLFTSPYFVLPISKKLIDFRKNCIGMKSFTNYNKYYGLCRKDIALKRVNIFISGDANFNVLEGLNWDKFAISGSMMPACLQKHNPLLDNYDTDQFNRFINDHYKDSDVDVISCVDGLFEFLRNVTEFMKCLANNINCNTKDIEIQCKKSISLIKTEYFEKYTGEIFRGEDFLENNLENSSKHIEILFERYKKKRHLMFEKIDEYLKEDNEWFDLRIINLVRDISDIEKLTIKSTKFNIIKDNNVSRDHEKCYFVNDFMEKHKKVPTGKNFMLFKICETVKFKLCTNRTKTFEIFMTRKADPFTTVAKFHLPCVRAYMQGENFWMLPSFITSMMTMVNMEYKCFAGASFSLDIINKYRKRGYGVILNKKEIESLYLYNHYGLPKNNNFYVEKKDDLYKLLDPTDRIYTGNLLTEKRVEDTMKNIFSDEKNKMDLYINNGIIGKIFQNVIGLDGNVCHPKLWEMRSCY
jgi:hypothetical protein